MIFTPRVRAAIRFSIKTHELDQKQKRKNKDVPYITHPLTVGLILARADTSEDTIIAGILHDTIEDSVPEMKVTREMVKELFGENVAELVDSVSEKTWLSWEERKAEALARVAIFSHDSLLVKSADLISNGTELVDDHKEFGDEIFANFERSKEVRNAHYLHMVDAVLARWPESPLAEDLQSAKKEMQKSFA
jgi:(p)ppGpp synthase/HD superfamily hydrolase